MPIIKSAKKRVKQAAKRRERNFPIRSEMKTHIRKVLELIKNNNKAEASKWMKVTYKIIDTATKKNIIHKNTAARKKSLLARKLAQLSAAPKEVKTPEKKKKTEAPSS